MPYSSKKQELFYQPHRIVVCQLDAGRYHGYAIYRADTTKRYPEEGFIAATWRPFKWDDTTGCWDDGYNHRLRYDSKQRAQKVAKEQAVLLSLPYSIKDDYYKSYRVLTGVQQTKCVICDKKIGYKAAPTACDDCRLDAERGKLMESEQGIYSVLARSLCSGHAGYDFNGPLASAFYKVVGDAPVGKSSCGVGTHELRRRRGKSLGMIAKGYSGGTGVHVSMTAVQAEALQSIVDIIEQIDQASFEIGKREGSNILTKLAAGELSTEAFAKERLE